MKILADENFPKLAVDALRMLGHDVIWISSNSPGICDADVLNKAAAEGRLLITFDKDFGELFFQDGMSSSAGIVLFRILPSCPEKIAEIAVAVLESRNDWSQHFSVVEEDRIRMIRMNPLDAFEE